MYPELLSVLIFMPGVCGLLLLAVRTYETVRRVALAVTALELGLCVYMLYSLSGQATPGRWLLFTDVPWIASLGARYCLGMDGISLLLLTLSSLMFMLSVGISWRSVTQRVGLFHAMLLVLQTGVAGVFLSADLLLFYLFWELMLVPMFFLIGVWGHGRRVYSALKFFLFTVTGSLLMLVSIIGIYTIHGRQTGDYTFLLDSLTITQMPLDVSIWLFAGFMLGFAVKVPIFPLHTWLPDAHTDAPTAGSVILAGLLLKTGTYGFVRFAFPLFPDAAVIISPYIFAFAVVGIFYAATIAFAQSDMKRLVAYSSVSHLAYVMLGVAAWNQISLAGSVMQMINHGITTGALFIMIGMLDERAHTRELYNYGGLWSSAPAFSAFFLLFILSSAGLPGLNNFAGEFLIIVGIWNTSPWLSAAALLGLVGSLTYLLRLAYKLLFGPMGPTSDKMREISLSELAVVVPLALLVVVIGVYPSLILRQIDEPVRLLATFTHTIVIGGH